MNTFPAKILEWAFAAAAWENFSQQDPSGKNKNPGNFKYGNGFFLQSLGATGADGVWAVFPTYTAGFNALATFLEEACQNELLGYHNDTLEQFYARYAPSTVGTSSANYATFIASALGVSIDTPISSLLT